MSSNTETSYGTAAHQPVRRNTYSLRRWSAFDAWQEHARKSAATVAFSDRSWRNDRDLRRAVITG